MSTAAIELFKEGLAAAQAGDLAKGGAIAERLLGRNPNDPNALQLLGIVLGKQGRLAEALNAFQHADRIAPRQPPILNSVATLLKQTGDLQSARRVFEELLSIAPNFVDAHLNLAALFVQLEDRALARRHFENALALEPNHPGALGKFARFLEQEHDIERAKELANRALAFTPHYAPAVLSAAQIMARDGEEKAALSLLIAALKQGRHEPIDQAIMLALVARYSERLGRHDESFKACKKANEIQKAFYGEPKRDALSPRSPEMLAALQSFFQQEDFTAWSAPESLEGPDPVFLLGFPRSGTTLLDQILSSHKNIVVLEEKENLRRAHQELLFAEGSFERWKSLTSSEVNAFRQAFWEAAGTHLQDNSSSKTVVEKLPLDTALLGLIYRLFPNSKIIFVLRDPRDVILSCLQQTFAMNEAMYQFLDMTTAVSYYDQVMRLGKLCRDRLPLNLHEIRYEHLISQTETSVRALLNFLNLPWDPAVTAYDETARRRVVRTPSARQVTQRPYSSSIGKWRHYKEQLKEALPTLDPWAEAFGYDV